MIIKARNGILVKGGAIVGCLRRLDTPTWMNPDILRIIDKLVFVRNYFVELRDTAKADNLFWYIVRNSGAGELPVLKDEPKGNALMYLYYLVTRAMEEPSPSTFFSKHVRIDGHNVVILELGE